MEVNKILNADILDIIFEGKNKEYGAYELRKTYNKRIIKAILGTAIIIALLFIGWFVSNISGGPKKAAMVVEDVHLTHVGRRQRSRQAAKHVDHPVEPPRHEQGSMGVHVEHPDRDRQVRHRQRGDQRHRQIPVRGGGHQQAEGQYPRPARDVHEREDIRRVLELAHPPTEWRFCGHRSCR